MTKGDLGQFLEKSGTPGKVRDWRKKRVE